MSLSPELAATLVQLTPHFEKMMDDCIVALNIALNILTPCFEQLIDNKIPKG
ncbi:hypothetical protein CROQUDRAFT_90773 [Cronartium quercuum f. sp. fusiforme G11]|uniref:Uncharacterized protein n=1 Tax=Cronartium quercuum f. sp. fusiforme G11 TaxID=708437 RepID=A0A9P6NJ93_9BASI|nr:hypothetical protein CROQUDRAFT_90773 [Cronartium quercuum f. sp. fusiforme G11]